ncbi:hypothetical protein TREMEDRAFT_64057 [Tremella mesenterica DSM 1558]|uniref:uncharacterized protein n=1 Tax=Tremella mesenterica (strain ATCC 24925 / CBS 8224 / DSM 1558 / NBRC 9311 / NRRL Y-6157 / RJB 2259-6 / UBC 559-6) TaxID=578456 RepID=UPI0003F49FE5|nr:uncharacterized protein TREMEDRAFT_64057 [Tremella mesenterica DSM 1558]EIW67465.1 hypothetical protein TREMEDRAFT_64057 [Tremella mesenterica DSM 1558]
MDGSFDHSVSPEQLKALDDSFSGDHPAIQPATQVSEPLPPMHSDDGARSQTENVVEGPVQLADQMNTSPRMAAAWIPGNPSETGDDFEDLNTRFFPLCFDLNDAWSDHMFTLGGPLSVAGSPRSDMAASLYEENQIPGPSRQIMDNGLGSFKDRFTSWLHWNGPGSAKWDNELERRLEEFDACHDNWFRDPSRLLDEDLIDGALTYINEAMDKSEVFHLTKLTYSHVPPRGYTLQHLEISPEDKQKCYPYSLSMSGPWGEEFQIKMFASNPGDDISHSICASEATRVLCSGKAHSNPLKETWMPNDQTGYGLDFDTVIYGSIEGSDKRFNFSLPDPNVIVKGLMKPKFCEAYKRIQSKLENGSVMRPQEVYSCLYESLCGDMVDGRVDSTLPFQPRSMHTHSKAENKSLFCLSDWDPTISNSVVATALARRLFESAIPANCSNIGSSLVKEGGSKITDAVETPQNTQRQERDVEVYKKSALALAIGDSFPDIKEFIEAMSHILKPEATAQGFVREEGDQEETQQTLKNMLDLERPEHW